MFAASGVLPFVSTAFPTLAKRIIWSVISLLTTLLFGVLFGLIYLSNQGVRPPIAKFSPLVLGIYILARIILFTLGFTTLRDLPPEALNTLHWPHFIFIFIGN